LFLSINSITQYKFVMSLSNLAPKDADWVDIDWNTTDVGQIELSQQQALKYNDCEGVCYATTGARINGAYYALYGQGVLDLTVSGKNPDHVASRGDQPHTYGVGQAIINHGFGIGLSQEDIWNGGLQKGASIQRWEIDSRGGVHGHSFIFRDYSYDSNGNINGINYTDYHGGVSNMPISRWKNQPDRSVMGVNLRDRE
jgi:hypothetical protein